MVSAHRDFTIKLSKLNFVVSYQEALLGCADLKEVLNVAIKGIHDAVEETDAAVFLLSDRGFDVHLADSGSSEPVEKQHFKHWFTRELVNTVSQMNRICTLEQLLRMGLQAPPGVLKTVSIAAIPLGRLGQGVGFVLVYRRSDLPLQAEELSRLAAVSGGLREAISSFPAAPAKASNKRLHV